MALVNTEQLDVCSRYIVGRWYKQQTAARATTLVQVQSPALSLVATLSSVIASVSSTSVSCLIEGKKKKVKKAIST